MLKFYLCMLNIFLLVDSVGISESITTGSTRGKGILNMKLCFNYCLMLHVLQRKEVLFKTSVLYSDLHFTNVKLSKHTLSFV